MKKLCTLFIVLVGSGILNISIAQTCTPDTAGYASVPDSGVLIPSPLPNAQVGVYYEQPITIGVPDSVSGYPLNWIQYSSLTNYLTGNSWTIVDSVGGTTFTHWPKLTWHCGTLKGTPAVAGTDSVIIYVNANVSIGGFPFTVNNTRAFSLPLIVDPVVGYQNYSNSTTELFRTYPNPFHDKIQIRLTVSKPDIATLNVYSGLGQLIYSEIKSIQLGDNYFTYNGISLIKGTYIFSVRTSEKTFYRNIIKTE